MTAIQFQHVSKRFRIGERRDALVNCMAGVRGLIFGRTGVKQEFWALKDVCFDVGAGEGVGIIGPNGAGKSTALKLLAGIMRPNHGQVRTRGRKAALIEVGAGFHGDLMGRENVYLNATLLGMRRAEIRRKLDSIVDFAGLARFLDTPVKRYSSGMYARLGFSVAVHVDPDILLVDEVLSVGDAMFRVRCLERMRQLVGAGTALVLVTHDLEQMRSICRRTIVLELGKVSFDGAPNAAAAKYLRAMSRGMFTRSTDVMEQADNQRIRVERLAVRDGFGDDVAHIGPDHFVRVELELALRSDSVRAAVELNLRRAEGGDNVLSLNSARHHREFHLTEGTNRLSVDLPQLPLCGGSYFWNIRVWDAATGATLLDTPFVYPLVVDDGGRGSGLLTLNVDWTLHNSRQNPEPSICEPNSAQKPCEVLHEHMLAS